MSADLTPKRLQREALALMDYFERRGLDPPNAMMVMARMLAAAFMDDEAGETFMALMQRFRELDRERGNTARGMDG